MGNEKEINADDLKKSLKQFGLADYVVFALMLIICSVVGIYFGFKDHKKQQKSKLKTRRGSAELDYLVGGRNMKTFPVAMSLVASGLSGITLLGMPTEVYIYGVKILYMLLPLPIMGLFVHYVVIPVFYDLQIVSTYEYLKQRFDNKVRLFGSLIFLLSNLLWLPIVIYVPALAFNQTTGVNLHVISVFVCVVCIFYTLLGGIKAVVWTDVIQVILMYGSLTVILVTGIIDIGGLSLVIERNVNSTRLDLPKLDFDLVERHSVLSLIIGGTTMLINLFAIGQAMVQRYMSLPSIKAARQALLWNIGGVIVMISICCFNGLVLYAKYFDCDPLTTKLVTARDQLMPLLVMENLSNVPGFAGLFIAGVFSASLSSLSTALNSAAAVVLEDFWKPIAKKELSEKATAYIMRATVFILGAVSVILVSVVQKMGGVLQLGMSLTSATSGPTFGLFFIGFFLPWIKAKGTLVGAALSLILSMYIAIRAQAAQATGELRYQTKPTSTDGCSYNFTAPTLSTTMPDLSTDATFQLHHISYFYYSFFGTVVTVVIAYIVTLVDRDTDPSTVDLKLLAPFMRKYFAKINSPSNTFTVEMTEHVFDVKDNQLITDDLQKIKR